MTRQFLEGGASSLSSLLDHIHSFTQHIGRTPLDEWPARRRKLYLTTHYTCRGRTSMPPAGFEPPMPTTRSHTPTH